MRRLFAVTLFLVAACGRSPSSPSAPSAGPQPSPATFDAFSGLWTAKYKITACEWERHCVQYMGSQRSFNLRLVQSGSLVRGLFVEGMSVADVEGSVSTDGTLTMTGYTPPTSPRDGSFRITQITIRQGASPELQGTVAYESQPSPQNAGITLGMKATGEIVSATRSDLSRVALSADGTYDGMFVVRRCTPISTACYPTEADELAVLKLTVTQSGSTLSATYREGSNTVALNGTMNGRTIDLAGETTVDGGGGAATFVRITGWHGSLDAFGRMSGTFHLDVVSPISKPSVGGSADCELVNLVKAAP
jgi:hypothetical protein